MSERQLTEAAWKTFAKGRGLKDAPLLKALAEADKAEKSGPDAQLKALEDLEKQADLLRKANKADKELGAYLDDMDKALARQRKTSEQAVKQAAAAAAEEGGDEESPAQLTTKLIPLLRAVPKGDVLRVMIALAGKDTAVLLSRKSISPAMRKILTEYLGVSGGTKFVAGECIFEANAHTFVVEGTASGLAKKLKAALFAQTGQRIKVRVRGESPDDVEEELEGDEAGQGAPGGAPGTTTGTAAGAAPDEPQAPAGQAGATSQTGQTSQTDETEAAAAFELALGSWRSARTTAVTKLKALAKEVADAKLPESATAIIQVSAVLKNLSAEPRTAQQVQQLVRYVNEDDVVEDVCSIDGDIRAPLVAALQAMQRALQLTGVA